MTEASVKHNGGPYMPRSRNYHLALAEYLHNELRSQGLKVRRKRGFELHVIHEASNESLVIDCLDGLIYLNNGTGLKSVGTLRAFGTGQRWADAYNCMKRSLRPIMRHVESTFTTETIVLSARDDRENSTADDVVKTMDMREEKRDEEEPVFINDMRKEPKSEFTIDLPIIDMRLAALPVYTHDLRIPPKNFITVVKALLRGIKSGITNIVR